ncbi:MAG: hypothetical protein RLZZ383_888 [Pseudomonadota bacterium]|jgi:hypothetical protein
MGGCVLKVDPRAIVSATLAVLLTTLGSLQDNPWPIAGGVVIAVLWVRSLGTDPAPTPPNP